MTFTSLTVTAGQVGELRDHLLREDELERAAFIHCSRSGNRLLAEEIHPVPDDQLRSQSKVRCRPELWVERDHIQDCHDRGMHFVLVHSHPFDRHPTFSSADDAVMDGLHRMMTGLFDHTTVGFAVLGTDGVTAGVSDRDTDCVRRVPVNVVGNRKLDPPVPCGNPSTSGVDAKIDKDRNERTMRAVSERGLQRLASTHVAVVGVGGLGSIEAEQLARYNVGHLTLIDPDVVEKSNLNRLAGAYEHHIGRPKVTAVKEHLHKVNPDIEVTAIQTPAEDAEDALKEVDLIVGGLDQVSARLWLNKFACRHLIEYVDAGVTIHTTNTEHGKRISGMHGTVQFIQPGATACYDCLGRGDRERARLEQLSDAEVQDEIERGYIDGTELSPEPAVVPLNGVVASKAVQVIANHITGYTSPDDGPADYIRLDLIGNELDAITTAPNEACATCGDTGVLGRGDREPSIDEVEAFPAGIDIEEPSGGAGPAFDESTKQRIAAYFGNLHPV